MRIFSHVSGDTWHSPSAAELGVLLVITAALTSRARSTYSATIASATKKTRLGGTSGVHTRVTCGIKFSGDWGRPASSTGERNACIRRLHVAGNIDGDWAGIQTQLGSEMRSYAGYTWHKKYRRRLGRDAGYTWHKRYRRRLGRNSGSTGERNAFICRLHVA